MFYRNGERAETNLVESCEGPDLDSCNHPISVNQCQSRLFTPCKEGIIDVGGGALG